MRINTNVSSITAQEAAVNTNNNIKSSLEKLSSGLRINKASDDASGLAIADKLRTQATSINQGVSNGNSAVTLLQIADKSMAEQSNILDTVKSKLIQANTDTTSADGRESIRKDIVKLLEQLDNIAEQTNYNGNVLLQASAGDKSSSDKLSFQIGESNADIISNTPVQSNTEGLGSKTVYSADNENNTIGNSQTITVSSSDSISLTSTNASGENTAETVTLSGDVDSLTLDAGTVISGMDENTKNAFESAYTLGNDYTQSGSTYTMTASKTLDLSAIDTVSATVTTAAEQPGAYTPTVGDVIEATDLNTSSALSQSLLGGDWQDNGNGTYTATAAVVADGPLTLEAGESANITSATNLQNFTAGQQITLSSNVKEGSEFDLALQSGDVTKVPGSGEDGESGTVYTVNNNFSASLGDGENASVYTPVPVTVATGDVIDTNAGTLVGSSDLSNALGDPAKFTDNSDGTYTALSAQTINLAATEDVDLFEAKEVTTDFTFGDVVTSNNVNPGSAMDDLLKDTTKFEDIGGGNFKFISSTSHTDNIKLEAGEDVTVKEATSQAIGTAKEGYTLTLTADVVAGSDLAKQLADTNLFTKTGAGVDGQNGTTYTVNADYSTDALKTIDGESFTLTATQALDIKTGVSNTNLLTDTISFETDGGATTNYDVDVAGTTPGTVIAEGAADDTDEQKISESGVLSFTVTAAGGETGTVGYQVGDKVAFNSITDTTGDTPAETNSMKAEMLESGNWELVEGSGATAVYQATTAGTFTFDEDTDSITIQRRVDVAAPVDSAPNTAEENVAMTGEDKTATAASTITGTSSSSTVSPSPTASVSFETGSSVNITNGGSTDNTLTMSGDAEISNGGTQLSALAAIGAGEMTAELASSFQTVVDDAISDLNGYRGDIGSTQNQVESAVRNLMTQATNVKAAESIIRDVDYAQESANFNKQNIISQAGSYAISQANSTQQNVLRLLQ